jgi:hypothetical protein
MDTLLTDTVMYLGWMLNIDVLLYIYLAQRPNLVVCGINNIQPEKP